MLDYGSLPAVVTIILGLFLLVLGYTMFRVSIRLVGFFIGGIIGFVVVSLPLACMPGGNEWKIVLLAIVTLLFAILGAMKIDSFYIFFVFLATSLLMFFMLEHFDFADLLPGMLARIRMSEYTRLLNHWVVHRDRHQI